VKRIITGSLIGAFALAPLGASLASGEAEQEGVTIEPLVNATIAERVRAQSAGVNLKTDGPKAVLTARITVEPGGSFGWHSHPGPVFVSVADGTFTLRQVENRRCRRHTFGPGEAFVEDGARVHLGENEGTEPVRIFATFLARARTTEFSREEDPPALCVR
jgi:quercetin dioxygenase-like cupin family protein